ncbi:MAG: type I glyceraldehyde-3-phosphate dehydrogenase [Candidatus Woesearchaeota archaeon]
MVRVAINGFGRIGRLVLRAGYGKLDFAAINDIGDLKESAHLLKYDSVHGKFSEKIRVEGSELVVAKTRMRFLSVREPEKLPWKELGIDVVLECTGLFTDRPGAGKHIVAGAKKVLISAPWKGTEHVTTIVKGVNDDRIKGEFILSCGSCTTNSLVPVIKVLLERFGIEKGFITTVHSYTNDQQILDLAHKDLRRSRAAAINIVPTSTGAAKAVKEVFPELAGKLDGVAIRVPTPDGSLTDFVAILAREASVQEINDSMKQACETHLKGVMEYCDEEIVSRDIIGNPHSAIFDSTLTKANGRLCKVFSWYDNEWGFANRMVELALKMAE